MITLFRLIRNIGQFDSFTGHPRTSLSRFAAVYAENGRGKTTVAAILRSLLGGDPNPIMERRRFNAAHEPHVVVDNDGAPCIFENASWNRTLPNIVVYDDHFTDSNVHSGLVVESDHRQNLHELIIGARGIALNNALQDRVDQIDEHNQVLRQRADALPARIRGPFSVDEYCALLPRADLEDALNDAERNLSAVSDAASVQRMPSLESINLGHFDLDDITRLLGATLQTLDATAIARLQEHFASLGDGGEQWIAEGMRRARQREGGTVVACPFCSQNVEADPLVTHYRAYFSDSYTSLKTEIDRAIYNVKASSSADAVGSVARIANTNDERVTFWSRFCELPRLALDSEALSREWVQAGEALLRVLESKKVAPLDAVPLPEESRALVERFNGAHETVTAYNDAVVAGNVQIALAKERSVTGSVSSITSDIERLKAIRQRFTDPVPAACADYIREKENKARTEVLRTEARAALDNYRQEIFPAYETAINEYLRRFNAGYRIGSMTSVNNRGGSSCVYNVLINDQEVRVGGAEAGPGEPAFRNTLSAGDRSTLALAFFFASLDQDDAVAQKTVVLDDPITSLDDHRQLATTQEIRRLSQRASQVIVLSHDKSFLLRTWQGADRAARTALQIVRVGDSSEIQLWDATQDSITEHDKRHELVAVYVANSTGDRRKVAESLRPILEAFIRVSYPREFPPESLLGNFQRASFDHIGTANEYLNAADTNELGDLLEYANRFHHDTNPAWADEYINGAELLGFATRTLRFTRKS